MARFQISRILDFGLIRLGLRAGFIEHYFSGLFSVTIFEAGDIYRGRHHGNALYFLDANQPIRYILPWYSAPTLVMHGIFWMVIGHSGTCSICAGTQPPL